MKEEKPEKQPVEKKIYRKPEITSEQLHTYGAVCNGTTTGQRKAFTSPPDNCNATRLNS